MDWLTQSLTDWLKDGLIEAIMNKFENMFDSINNQVESIAGSIGQTPQEWNANVFTMIRSLSDTVILPIAGVILTFVVCYELIHMLIERNNMHDFETFVIYKWIIKTFCAVFILSHTFDIVMGIFGLAQQVVNQSAGVITGSLRLTAEATAAEFRTQITAMGVWELAGLFLEMFIIDFCFWVMTVVIFIIIFGRMIEIFLTVSVAPIPLATMANREWGQIGNNYLKLLFALGFQCFFIMVCIAIYAALVQNIPTSANVHASIWSAAGYAVLLVFCLFKTSSLSKAIFGAR